MNFCNGVFLIKNKTFKNSKNFSKIIKKKLDMN